MGNLTVTPQRAISREIAQWATLQRAPNPAVIRPPQVQPHFYENHEFAFAIYGTAQWLLSTQNAHPFASTTAGQFGKGVAYFTHLVMAALGAQGVPT